MRRKAFKAVFLLLMICSSAGSQSLSRSVVSVLGSSTEAGGYYLSQTAGEAVDSTVKAGFHYLTQGFQQPSLINRQPDLPPEPLDAIDVYPNPVRDKLTVSFRIVELKTYYVLVIDGMGRVLMKKRYDSMNTRDEMYDFSPFPPGLYLIHVYSANMKMNRVFKIEKL